MHLFDFYPEVFWSPDINHSTFTMHSDDFIWQNTHNSHAQVVRFMSVRVWAVLVLVSFFWSRCVHRCRVLLYPRVELKERSMYFGNDGTNFQ